MNLRIETASENDVPAIIALMREFAEFEKLLDSLEVTAEKLHRALFGENPFVRCLLAFDGAKPVAYALFYPHFASFRGEISVYLEDIYISENYRQHGLGKILLKEIARAGRKIGAVRMDFQVLDWNVSAINFYQKHGAEMDESERHFRFHGAAFEQLAA